MNGDRDVELGAALSQLDVPEHGPDFVPALLARLERETAVSRPLRRIFPRVPRPLFVTLAVAGIAAAVLAVTMIMPGGNSTFLSPRVATAAEVRTRVAASLASAHSLQGELSFTCAVSFGDCAPPEAGGGTTTLRWTVAATAAGDERITGIGSGDDSAYDVTARTAREVVTSGSAKPRANESVNLPAGPPDYTRRSPLNREFGSMVRAFLATTGEGPVEAGAYDGRKVWFVSIPVEVNKLAGPGNSGDRIDVVVDQQTGFPMQVTESLATEPLLEARLTKLVIDAPVAASSFALTFPTNVKPFHQDYAFERTTVDQAASIVGYQPLLPTDIPKGFTLAEVTAAAKGSATGNEGMNPPGAGVVSVAYRRGFDRIVVTTRLRAGIARCVGNGSDSSACWADPVASGEGIADEPQPFVIARGALSGVRADLVLSPRGIPHVWTIGDRLVVTIAGDASGAELRRMAESFAAR
jgi:hypothetical protein